jgi:hypothetical protein
VRIQTDWLFRPGLLGMVIDAGKAMRARCNFVVVAQILDAMGLFRQSEGEAACRRGSE